MARRRVKIWQEAVAASGLRVEKVSWPWALRPWLQARNGPLTVRIQSAGVFTRVVIEVAGPPGFSDVRIRPRRAAQDGGRGLKVGDEIFEASFVVEGPERLVVALLGAELRRLLGDIKVVSQLEIAAGEIRVELADDRLELLLSLLATAGRRIAGTVDIPRRLILNIQQDPTPGVRRRNLSLLAREAPGAPETVEVLRAACLDPAPEVRLAAALELGAEAEYILLELADSLVADEVSAQAITGLGRELPFERTKEILALARRRRRLETARACVEALGRSGEAEAIEILAEILEGEGSALAVAAAGALGETGDPAAEAPLLRVLQREQTDVQVAAAIALGRVGSVAAVLPLKEADEAAANLPELRRAARQSVAEIQSRLQGASPGQLSLAQAEAGQLSLAVDPAGQLSISGDGAPAPPHPP